MLIGIEDNGAITGVANDIARLSKQSADNYIKTLMDNLLSRIGKVEVADVRLSLQAIDGQQILSIEVPRGLQSAYCKDGTKPIFYIRVSNQCQALEGKESEQYILKRWGHS